MKSIHTICLLLVSQCLLAQNRPSIEKIDAVVDFIEANASSKNSFSTQHIYKNNKKIIQQYTYYTNGTMLTKIVCSCLFDNKKTEQTFYIKSNALVFAKEAIISHYKTAAQVDSTSWMGQYYFSKGKLIDEHTFGHGKSEEEGWNPQKEVLDNYKKARKEVLKYMGK